MPRDAACQGQTDMFCLRIELGVVNLELTVVLASRYSDLQLWLWMMNVCLELAPAIRGQLLSVLR